MDELELLKKDWKNQEKDLPRLSYDEIYKMILKKSSSIVRWIFIISILEFVFWTSIDIVYKFTGKMDQIEITGMETVTAIYGILSYGFLLYFIIRFYINYKKIKATDSAKVLMQNILKTRRTVKWYVGILLGLIALFGIIETSYILFTDKTPGDTPFSMESPVIQIVGVVVVIALFVGVFALFYRLIYGILTRRLKRNYKELEKLEI